MDKRPHLRLNSPSKRSSIQSSRKPVVLERPYAHLSETDMVSANVSQTTALTVAQLSRKMVQNKKVVQAARTAKAQPGLPRQSRSKVLRRHMVKPVAKKQHPKYRQPLKRTIMTSMAVVTFLAGALIAAYSFKINRDAKVQNQVLAVSSSQKNSAELTPSEDEPSHDLSTYRVAADAPRMLVIDKLGVQARIFPLSAHINNALESPSNIFDAGWYSMSAKPGETGAMVINGHVSGLTKQGIFSNIRSLKEGDKLEIERGDGKKYGYTVVGIQAYANDKVDIAELLAPASPGKPGLNLITSTGRFNIRTNQFEERHAVFAIQD